MTRVLVCGGRDYDDVGAFNVGMNATHSAFPFSVVIEGGASGADCYARLWAIAHDIPVITEKADWAKHGNAAGPIRNQKMIDEHKPDLVIAFEGGRGTMDMIRRAEAAGLTVIKFGSPAWLASVHSPRKPVPSASARRERDT